MVKKIREFSDFSRSFGARAFLVLFGLTTGLATLAMFLLLDVGEVPTSYLLALAIVASGAAIGWLIRK